jgi:hypothetical protein
MDATTESPAPIADLPVAESIETTPLELGLPPKRLTRPELLSKLQTLNCKASITSKTTVPELRSLIEDLEQNSSLSDTSKVGELYATPSKNSDNFSGLNPAINSSPTTAFEKSVSEAYNVIRNPIMVKAGQYDILQSFLEELGFDSREAMQYLITVPEYMEQIAEYLKPLGKIIFLRAIPAESSPQKAKKVRSSPTKNQTASPAVKMVQDYLKDFPLAKGAADERKSEDVKAVNAALAKEAADVRKLEDVKAALTISANEVAGLKALAIAPVAPLNAPELRSRNYLRTEGSAPAGER